MDEGGSCRAAARGCSLSPVTRRAEAAGVTLIETVVAILVMATAVLALLAGSTALSRGSTVDRQAASTDIVVRDYAEALVAAVRGNAAGTWCRSSYAVAYTVPSGYRVTPTIGACPANNASTPQFQTIRLTATSPHGLTERLTFVVRKP
jgi:Tfp pilus assembly protein PilV